ncbi:DUF4238 domain-containing protein [Chitinophaga niabensis]|uniref:DUF4238 domain-containing protein n=1 Tax=Chitinophaga niabensis TaxID=536979 RepID=A0A1N6E234_9BACT|nr:DUF4238 domain-containing protein [Chitinophaga niabensis]SIN77079.1 Protein of unknown function [Chitinophaga niabensis]
MGAPKHQHFIPKSFLKQFATKAEEGRYLVDTLMRGSDEIKTLTTTQVCVQKNIYTFPPETPGDRFSLEKRYASEVDDIYPSVYNLLIDTELTSLSKEQKRSVLNTILSLYFRTPFFLNDENEKLDKSFDGFNDRLNSGDDIIEYIDEWNEAHVINMENIEEIRAALKVKNKLFFLDNHLEQWKRFVDYKMECGIEVMEVPAEVPLISSDNPVLILGPDSKPNPHNIFDQHNIIEIALDRKHYLVIYPNAVSEGERLELRRGKRDKRFAAGVNLRTEETSDGRILGYPGDVKAHFESQKALGAHTEENIKDFKNIRDKATGLAELFIIAKKTGSMFSKESIAKAKEIKDSGIMDNDDAFKKLMGTYSAMGIKL